MFKGIFVEEDKVPRHLPTVPTGVLFAPSAGRPAAAGLILLRDPVPRGAQTQRLIRDYGDYLVVALDIDIRGRQSYTFNLRNRDGLGAFQRTRLQAEMWAEFAHQRGYTEIDKLITQMTLEGEPVANRLLAALGRVLQLPSETLGLPMAPQIGAATVPALAR